jgi:hypothetical protein
MPYLLANLALWTIVLLATLFSIGEAPSGHRLAALIAICMIGSTLLLRRAQTQQSRER